MIDIQKVTNAAVKRAIETEKLPSFSQEASISFDSIRKRNYPFDRTLHEYHVALPLLQELKLNDKSILDIGMGSGKAIQELESKTGCFAIGTGIAPISNSRVRLVITEGASLPFKDNSFDFVISVQGISWSPDQHKAINEAIRILKPGGYCLLALIRFTASVTIWYGDSFWDDLKIDKEDFSAEFDFKPDLEIPKTRIKVTKIDVPMKSYKEKFYVECLKY